MVKKTKRTAVDRNRAPRYSDAGAQFFEAAELAREFEYWNAAGLLYVHSAIAYADAVAIQRRGEKSTSENHFDAVALFKEATADIPRRQEALTHLDRIIEEKSRVAYSGVSFRRGDLEKLRTHTERFRSFAERTLRM